MYDFVFFLQILILISTHSNNPQKLFNALKIVSLPLLFFSLYTITVLHQIHHTNPFSIDPSHFLTLFAHPVYQASWSPPSLSLTKYYIFNSYYTFILEPPDYTHLFCDFNTMCDKRRSNYVRFHPFHQGWFFILK